ncbi:AimR family lysis-lysogeny pheromone receptor [Bacillus cereus]|uniref:AimR family lysis-lysogeny pheromone receptor n=1 Tax=Bacillus cereus TaxID=1396 RepID=UPI0021116B45|nr:AimR family lysis-lysogeny pheromone receptor [Bacillus cereus]
MSQSMIEFIQDIEKDRDANDIKVRQLERITGIDRCTIEDGLSGKTKEMKLENFISIVNVIYKEVSIRRNKIEQFILLCDKNGNVIKSLIYSQVQGHYELVFKLLKKHARKTRIKAYLKIFSLYNKRNFNKKTGKRLEKELDRKKFPNSPEIYVLVQMLYGYAKYDIPNCRAMIPYSEKAKARIPSIQNKFIKECLEMQYKERDAFIKLLSDEVEESREICLEVINAPNASLEYPIIVSSAYCCLGESYQYECIFTSEKFLEMSIEILEENHIDKTSKKYKAFKTTLAHLYIDNAFNLEKIDHEYVDIGEEGHFQLKFGDAELGEKLYAKMEKKGLSPHKRASRAKVKGNIEELKRALLEFEKIGNLFYANGIKRVLIKEEVKVDE